MAPVRPIDWTVEVRRVEPRDATEWVAMRLALWPDEDPALIASDVTRFLDPNVPHDTTLEAVFVAETIARPRRLVGFAEISRRAYAEGCDSSPVGYLEGWFVMPEYQRHGIGRALVAAGEAWARAQGCREFASDALVDNRVSLAAHQAMGFEEVEIIRCFRKSLTRDP